MKYWAIGKKLGNGGKIGYQKIPFYISIIAYGLEYFLTNVGKQINHVMLKLVRIPWYRRLNDQSVHINETFKDYHGMILHPS